MQNNDQQIKAYLQGQMTDPEKRLFEAEMRNDTALQQAAIDHVLKLTEADETLLKIRREVGPLPKPKLELMDRIRFFLYGIRPAVVIVCATVLVFLGLIFRFWPTPCDKLIDEAFIKPYCGDVAGNTIQADQNLKNKAAYLFCGVTSGGIDSLLVLAGQGQAFNIANFYLAHAYLEKNEYAKASGEFEKCRINRQHLRAYDLTGYEEIIAFNTLLAKMGQDCNVPLAELDGFIARYPQNHKATALHKALRNPLRKIIRQ